MLWWEFEPMPVTGVGRTETDKRRNGMFHSMRLAPAVALALLLGTATPVTAADTPTEESARSRLGLYVTAVEAHAMITKGDRKVVLVDVRDPVEIMFTGNTALTDIFEPWQIADTSRFNPKKPVYAMVPNPDFLPRLEAKLAAIGAGKDTPLIIMCRSGSTRSAPVADLLANEGYTQVYSMVDGFEGGTLKEGPSKGVRARDGWRNAGLPWSYDLDPAKAWTSIP